MRQFPSDSWADWSCTARVSVADSAALAPAVRQVRELMGEVEQAASRFLPSSELNRVNAQPGTPLPVSRTLSELVAVALAAAEETDGAVDPTVGLDLISAGYDRDIAALRAAGSSAEDEPLGARSARARPNWRQVSLDEASGLLRIPFGAALDLGATAKAWTADRGAAAVARRYDTPVLVEIGGDLAVAGAPDGGWRIRVAERAGGAGQDIGVHAGGVATSTTTVRTWRRAGRTLHHLIDPASGEPVRGPWRTASVAADSALAANTASTAAIVLGSAAEPWLARRGVPARLVGQDGVVRLVGEWPLDVSPAA